MVNLKHDRNDVPCMKAVVGTHGRAGNNQRTCVYLLQLHQMRYLARLANVLTSSSSSSLSLPSSLSSTNHTENIKQRYAH